MPATAIRSPGPAAKSALFWPGVVAIGLASVAIARHASGGGFGGQSTLNGILELSAGWSILAAGYVLLGTPGRRAGLLLVAAGCCWFLLEWNAADSGSAVVFTTGLVCSALLPALVAHAALAYPEGTLRGLVERITVAAAYSVIGLLLGIGSALVFEPEDAGCEQCPRNLLVVHSAPGLYDDLNELGLRLGLATLAAVSLTLARRLIRASRLSLRREGPVVAAAFVFTLLVAWDYAHGLARGSLGNDPFDTRLWRAEAAALLALAAGVWWGRFRQRRARGAIAQLVLELGRRPRRGGIRDALARQLGDPELQLAYLRPSGRAWVDANGEPTSLEPRTGRNVTPILSNGRQLGALVHAEALLEDAPLITEAVAAASLAIESEALEAEVRAQLAELRRSRARIVEAGDLERSRLERDLHDGAQQHLVGLLFSLRIALAQRAGDTQSTLATRLDEAAAELGRALDELRDLAHGIHPVSLTEEGLSAALESLAERCTVRVELVDLPQQRFAPAVEAAAYLVVAEAAKAVELCGGTRVSVALSCRAESLVVRVIADGWSERDLDRDARLLEFRDRVGAADGRVDVTLGADAVELLVELPCA